LLWVGASPRQKAVRTGSEVEGIASWLEGALREQDLAREADVAEKRLEAALPPPDVDEVLSRLRSGARIRTGGGRFYREFFWDTRLRCEIFDEGSSDLVDATEHDLEAQLRNSPDAFRRALEEK
jgi:hypothetical protein